MIKTLRLVNFQSHEDTTLEFSDNINVIYGLSDSGKSSVVRGMSSILQKDSFYIRKGEEEGRIELSFNDYSFIRKYAQAKISKCPSCKEKLEEGNYICKCGEVIDQKMKEDCYIVDKEKHEKFGIKLPDFILNKTKLYPIDFVDFQEFLNISHQHSEMFFIGKSYGGTTRNKIISSLLPDSEKVDLALKNLNSEIQRESTELEIHSSTLATTSEKLEKLQETLELTKLVNEKLEVLAKKIEETKEKLDLLRSMNDQVIKVNKTLLIKETISKTEKYFELMKKILSRNTKIQEDLEKITDYKNRLTKLVGIEKFLFLDFKFDTETMNKLNKSISNLKQAKFDIGKLKAMSEFNLMDFKFKIPDRTSLNRLQVLKQDYIRAYVVAERYGAELWECKKELVKAFEKNPLCPITQKEYCDECKRFLRG